MGKKSNLIHEMKDNLKKETKYGESKHLAKQLAREKVNYQQPKGIYSTNTYKSYSKSCEHFIKYCLEHHHDIHRLDDCRQYVSEYLRDNENRGLSAWTIHLRASAIASMYHTTKDTFDYKCPERSRADIIRSRNTNTDTINNERYERIKEFCRATGARRIGLTRLTEKDLRTSEKGHLEIHLREKNGMERWARVDPEKEDFVKSVFKESPKYSIHGENRIFHRSDIPKNLELHSCRASYATRMYSVFYKEGYATGELYHCRKDKVGLTYDRGVLKEVSENLGHHRVDVVVNNYLYK